MSRIEEDYEIVSDVARSWIGGILWFYAVIIGYIAVILIVVGIAAAFTYHPVLSVLIVIGLIIWLVDRGKKTGARRRAEEAARENAALELEARRRSAEELEREGDQNAGTPSGRRSLIDALKTWHAIGDQTGMGRCLAKLGLVAEQSGEGVELFYALSAARRVCVTFSKAAGVVAEITVGRQDAGAHRVYWDGRDAFAVLVPAGAYTARVAAQGEHPTPFTATCQVSIRR